ncbi:uncharacterized protein [Primulina huaijiensis]|uniref:uncharacterized protein n=1 Tax=Primulina huaijiensis TaxID=1492673 RepID=UPI003CC77D96
MDKVSTTETEGPSIVAEEPPLPEESQYINNMNFGGYGGYRGNPPPNTYHFGLINHENFSYANNKNVLNPPSGFNTSKEEGKPSFENLVRTFVAESGTRMARTESRLDSMEIHIGNMGATMKSLEAQIGHLATALRDQNRGHSPSNTEVNPKEQCKAITLRSGKELEVESSKKKVESEKTVEVGEYEERKEKKIEESYTEVEVERTRILNLTLPYPQRFKKKNLDDQFAKFINIFKKIHINIPFADALEKMPNYAKFIKDVMSKWRKLQDRALCDLGASINLISFSIYKELELGEVKITTTTLQLEDRSLTYPRGIIEDVLEDHDAPLIFGRPFLATGRELINVNKGELTLRVGGKAVIFNIYHAMKWSNEVSTCKSIDVIDSCVHLDCPGIRDPLESCLVGAAGTDDEDDWEVKEQLLALDALRKEEKQMHRLRS